MSKELDSAFAVSPRQRQPSRAHPRDRRIVSRAAGAGRRPCFHSFSFLCVDPQGFRAVTSARRKGDAEAALRGLGVTNKEEA